MRDSSGNFIELLVRTGSIAFAYATPWALLIACTVAATLTYGRLAADNEIDAIRTSGVHLNTVVMPGVLFALVVTGLSLVIYQEILPRALFARRNLLRELAVTVLHNPPPGRQSFRLGDRVTLAYQDARDGRIFMPVLDLYDKEGDHEATLSGLEARAVFAPGEPPVVTLLEGEFRRYGPNGSLTAVGTFNGEHSFPLPIDPTIPKPQASGDMTMEQLEEHIAPGHPGWGDARAVTEYYSRFGRSVGPVALILMAIPLGMFVRKGSRLAGLGMALPPLLGYIVLMLLFEGFGRRGRIPPLVAGTAASLSLLLLSAALLVRAYRR
jgi:lipopolysaccharide export LptBFGC system permease protein LptF